MEIGERERGRERERECVCAHESKGAHLELLVTLIGSEQLCCVVLFCLAEIRGVSSRERERERKRERERECVCVRVWRQSVSVCERLLYHVWGAQWLELDLFRSLRIIHKGRRECVQVMSSNRHKRALSIRGED